MENCKLHIQDWVLLNEKWQIIKDIKCDCLKKYVCQTIVDLLEKGNPELAERILDWGSSWIWGMYCW